MENVFAQLDFPNQGAVLLLYRSVSNLRELCLNIIFYLKMKDFTKDGKY